MTRSSHHVPPGRPLLYAVLFHLLLACLFVLVRMDSAPQSREYFEVALAQAPPTGSRDNTDELDRRRLQPMAGDRAASGSLADLPERRMLMDEDDVTVPAIDDRAVDASSGDVGGKVSQADYAREERDWSPDGSNASTGKRGVTEVDDRNTRQNRIFEFGSRQGTENSAYSLEWITGGSRKLVNQVNPQYPAGLNRETVIRLRFRVLPDGSVDRVIPVRKGDPRLEEISLRAFAAWRFEPLSPSAAQTVQEGFITFIFKLK